MDMKDVAELLRRDVRAALASVPERDRRGLLREFEREYEEALRWMKKMVALAIADESRMEKAGSPAWAQQRASVDRLKEALRALNQKRVSVAEMVAVLADRAGSTRTPRALPEQRRIHVSIHAPRHAVSRDHEPPLLLTASGPPGGVDTLHVYQAKTGATWAEAYPGVAEALAGSEGAEERTVKIGHRKLLVRGQVRPSMPPRNVVTFVVLVPWATGRLVAVRTLESGPLVDWGQLRSCQLLASLNVEEESQA